MLRIPSPTLFHKREQWKKKLKEKIAADLLLSYAYRKGGRLQEIISFLETCCEESYILAQKEMFAEYGACERCKGSGNIILAYVPCKEGEKGKTRHAFCACRRGRELKEIIATYYAKKYE